MEEKNSKGSSQTQPEEPKKKSTKRLTKAELQRKLEQTEAELKQKHEHLLRVAAEFENYKKRVNREFNMLVKTANENLIRQLLPVLDNLERALDHSETDSASLSEGVKMILNQFLEVLEKEGVKPLDAVGKPFDPRFHEALMQVEDKEHPPGIVVKEVEKGYILNDKVLRHSKVVVSK